MSHLNCPEPGSDAAACWSVISNTFKGSVSVDKMLKVLSERGVNSVDELVKLYGAHNGLQTTVAKYIYLTDIGPNSFGVMRNEICNLMRSKYDYAIDESICVNIKPVKANAIRWYIGEVLGVEYVPGNRYRSRHSDMRTLTNITLICADDVNALVRILFEGKEIKVPRVRTYENIFAGEVVYSNQIVNCAAVIKKGKTLSLASVADEINMVGAMKCYTDERVQTAWKEWKASGFWKPFYSRIKK